MSINIRKYKQSDLEIWDKFIKQTNNGTLFHYRSFLNYHENIQFEDHSLLFYKNNKLVALLPATIEKSILRRDTILIF